MVKQVFATDFVVMNIWGSVSIFQSINESEGRVRERFISRFSESVRERFPFQLQTHFILDKANPCTINASDISSIDAYNRAL